MQNANTPKEIQNAKPRAVLGSAAPQFVISNDRNEEMINIAKNFGLIFIGLLIKGYPYRYLI
jgi:hypothetical protein